VLGPAGAGKQTLVRQLLAREIAAVPPPPDWCYVHNFDAPHKPRALRLPAGRGAKLRLLTEPLDIPRIERELPPGYLVLLRDTIAVTRISAGTAVNDTGAPPG